MRGTVPNAVEFFCCYFHFRFYTVAGFRAHVNNYRGAENAVRENHGVKLHDSVKVVKSLSESTRKRR